MGLLTTVFFALGLVHTLLCPFFIFWPDEVLREADDHFIVARSNSQLVGGNGLRHLVTDIGSFHGAVGMIYLSIPGHLSHRGLQVLAAVCMVFYGGLTPLTEVMSYLGHVQYFVLVTSMTAFILLLVGLIADGPSQKKLKADDSIPMSGEVGQPF